MSFFLPTLTLPRMDWEDQGNLIFVLCSKIKFLAMEALLFSFFFLVHFSPPFSIWLLTWSPWPRHSTDICFILIWLNRHVAPAQYFWEGVLWSTKHLDFTYSYSFDPFRGSSTLLSVQSCQCRWSHLQKHLQGHLQGALSHKVPTFYIFWEKTEFIVHVCVYVCVFLVDSNVI